MGDEGLLRVLLVDDHAIVRRGVRNLLADAFSRSAFGEAEHPHASMAPLEGQRWDVVLLDISLPGRGGMDLLKEVKRLYPQLPVLVLSMHPEAQYAARVLRAGAAGYVTKGSDPAILIEAVHKVLTGGTY